MTDEQTRFLHLLDELKNANQLITDGFGALQEINTSNDFYHLPHQLMASGLERLLKCYISVVYQGRTGSFPDMKFMKSLGHNLEDLTAEIWQNYYSGRNRPFVEREFNALTSDQHLNDAIRVLSLFGRFGRYYNLDVVAGSPHNPVDPKTEWEALESRIESSDLYFFDMERLHHEYYPRVHSLLVGRLERFVRAIASQFTLGRHPDPNKFISQASVTFSNFRNLKDKRLGQNDYRRSVKILQSKKDNWIKRTEEQILNSGNPIRIVERKNFTGDWPFRADRVILECVDLTFLIVNINGYAYSLNGSAVSRFKFPSAHDAGMAILGKSIGPFSEMARELRS
ncbi:hypothetical protein CWE09_07785 [Aliidiomarina minuta]|uniref:Uncharacterized protein n=1 Tax=Aliidiomarina minuta TaxID=880057 RepID=A0A432W8W3_9GAMM|nr:hypothetical protein [Aliidiomarina minuta]RUO26593.1 hypothetical protein CWE09_07785 [Aliidiomarina minuta]